MSYGYLAKFYKNNHIFIFHNFIFNYYLTITAKVLVNITRPQRFIHGYFDSPSGFTAGPLQVLAIWRNILSDTGKWPFLSLHLFTNFSHVSRYYLRYSFKGLVKQWMGQDGVTSCMSYSARDSPGSIASADPSH